MEYFYLDNNNNKVKLNLTQNMDLSKVNIDNEQLNSIFSKIDNGDGILQEKELNLLNKLLKKADMSIKVSANNGILENEELQKINEQLENGEIKLPQNNNPADIERKPSNCGYIEREYSAKDYAQMRDNPKFFENEITKIKNQLTEKFPASQYDIEVTKQGRGYTYNIYPKDISEPKTLTQTTSIIRADGTEIEMKDYLDEDVANDDNGGKLNYQATNFGTLTITDKSGNKQKINFHFSEYIGKDAVDCRRMQKIAADFLANLPEKTINQLIEHNISEINFESGSDINEEEYEEEYYQKVTQGIAKDGYYMDEQLSDILGNSVTVICPKFAVPKREYSKESTITRDDGYKFQLNDTSENTSVLKTGTPSGETFRIEINSSHDTDKYHQWQLPKLKQMLSELPESVLEDLANEIDGIQLMDDWNIAGNGVYALGTNTIAFKADDDGNTPTISFVHELGHAIDNQNGTMFSKTPKFNNKFEEFTGLMAKLNINGNHSTENSAEFFASVYAYQSLPGDTSENNHIGFLKEKLDAFKDSTNPDEKKCYELFQELQQDVSDFVTHARKQPKSVRADNTIKELVQKECKDLIKEMDKYSEVHNLIGQSTLLELTQTLSYGDEDFEKAVKFYEKMSSEGAEGAPIWSEVRELYGKMAVKMRELRLQIKQ